MNHDRSSTNLTRSICEEALEKFSASDDSLAGIIEANHIEVRDFMILSFVCDQSELSVEQLMSALGLTRESVFDCVRRLRSAELVAYRKVATVTDRQETITPTAEGRILCRRVLENNRKP